LSSPVAELRYLKELGRVKRRVLLGRVDNSYSAAIFLFQFQLGGVID